MILRAVRRQNVGTEQSVLAKMKLRLISSIIVCCAFLCVAFSNSIEMKQFKGSVSQSQEIIKEVEQDLLLSLAKEIGHEAEWDTDNDCAKFEHEDWVIQIWPMLGDDGETQDSIMIQATLDGTELSVEDVNSWNWENRFGRMYVNTDDEKLVIEHDLDLSGGVTRKALVKFLKRFIQTVDSANELL